MTSKNTNLKYENEISEAFTIVFHPDPFAYSRACVRGLARQDEEKLEETRVQEWRIHYEDDSESGTRFPSTSTVRKPHLVPSLLARANLL